EDFCFCQRRTTIDERPATNDQRRHKKTPILADRGSMISRTVVLLSGLSRRKQLPVAQGFHIAEHRRSRWQAPWILEVQVENDISRGRAINGSAALVNPSVIGGVIQAHDRAFVVEVLSTPVFQVTQEVVHPSVGSVIVGRGPARRLREIDVLSACNRDPVVGGSGNPIVEIGDLIAAGARPTLPKSLQLFDWKLTASATMAAAACPAMSTAGVFQVVSVELV